MPLFPKLRHTAIVTCTAQGFASVMLVLTHNNPPSCHLAGSSLASNPRIVSENSFEGGHLGRVTVWEGWPNQW